MVPLVVSTFGKLVPSAQGFLHSFTDVVHRGSWLRIAQQYLSCASVRGMGKTFVMVKRLHQQGHQIQHYSRENQVQKPSRNHQLRLQQYSTCSGIPRQYSTGDEQRKEDSMHTPVHESQCTNGYQQFRTKARNEWPSLGSKIHAGNRKFQDKVRKGHNRTRAAWHPLSAWSAEISRLVVAKETEAEQARVGNPERHTCSDLC